KFLWASEGLWLCPASTRGRQFFLLASGQSLAPSARRTSLPPQSPSTGFWRGPLDSPRALSAASRRQNRYERCSPPPLGTCHLARHGARLSRFPKTSKRVDGQNAHARIACPLSHHRSMLSP